MTGWSTWREICGGAVIVCLIMALAAGTGGRANAEDSAISFPFCAYEKMRACSAVSPHRMNMGVSCITVPSFGR